jgi:hypothetical protein
VNLEIAQVMDKIGVLGPPEGMPRRKFLAEVSGVPGVIDLIAQEEIAAKQMQDFQAEQVAQAEMAGQMAQTPAGMPGVQLPGELPGGAEPLPENQIGGF